MILLGLWCPIGLGEGGQVVRLDLVDSGLICARAFELGLGCTGLEVFVEVGPVGIGQVRLHPVACNTSNSYYIFSSEFPKHR